MLSILLFKVEFPKSIRRDDIRILLLYLSQLYPEAPFYAFGCSLGANVLTKYCGEEPDTILKGAVVLSNPFVLCRDRRAPLFLLQVELLERPFDTREHLVRARHFEGQCVSITFAPTLDNDNTSKVASNLRNLFSKYEAHFKDDPRIYWQCVFDNPKQQSLYCFDSQVTAALGGFKSVEHYYLTQSSDQFVPRIRIPFVAFNSLDDPVASGACVPYDLIKSNPYCAMITTRTGGHLGWFEPSAYFTKKRWIRKPVMEWAFFDLGLTPVMLLPDSLALYKRLTRQSSEPGRAHPQKRSL